MMMDNWMPYAGMQVLDLKALAYSVVARYAGDAERSNWGGKSAFLKAPVFALYGEHTSRTEDGWITEGHDIGGVSLLVEDGVERFEVKRTRKRGKSTVLTVTPEGAAQLKGEEAQKFLSERMGLTAADFGATCYFEQRQMARMVLAKPQDPDGHRGSLATAGAARGRRGAGQEGAVGPVAGAREAHQPAQRRFAGGDRGAGATSPWPRSPVSWS